MSTSGPSVRVSRHRADLKRLALDEWDDFLTANSRLPGPRANLELAMAFAEEASPRLINRLARSTNEFLALCGAVGLGRLAVEQVGLRAEAAAKARKSLRALASDDRWRVREGVAMALQRLGDESPNQMMSLARDWVRDPDWLVQRAAVAGICEPRHVSRPVVARQAIGLVDRATRNLAGPFAEQRKTPGFRALRQTLGYCWSVVVAGAPGAGFDTFDNWAGSTDPDIRWVVQTNLTKKRLQSADRDR